MNKEAKPLPLGKDALKIKICVANYRPMHPLTRQAINNLVKLHTFKWKFEVYDVASIAHARTMLTRDADQFDYILFIDTDIVFSTDDFLKLLQHRKPIVGGAYKHIYQESFVGGFSGGSDIMPLTSKGFKPCEWVPMGFTLIETDVFKAMKKPYFSMPSGENEEVEWEDYNFCKQHPGKVFINFDVKLTHIPRQKCVYLQDELWADVLKAVIELPLPFNRSSSIITTLKHYLE